MSLSQDIRNDPRVQELVSTANLKGRRYFKADGSKINLFEEIQKLGYQLGRSTTAIVIAQIQGRLPLPRKIDFKQPEPIPDSDTPEITETLPDAKLGTKKPLSSESDRYQLLRTHSRGTGRCSWQVWDDRAHCVIHVAGNGKSALQYIDQLVEADKGFKIGVKYGRPLTIENSDTEEPNIVDQNDFSELEEVFA
jgi:hypothetical protein